MPYRSDHRKGKRARILAAALLCACTLAAAALSGCSLLGGDRAKIAAASSAGTSSAGTSSAVSPQVASSAPSSPAAAASAAASPLKAAAVTLQNAEKPLWISVSIANQTLTVYDAKSRVVESWLCSTGSPGYDTPTGTFHIYRRGKSFYSKKYQEGAYYYVAFYEDYYIHSVPFDQNRNIIPTVAKDLGHKDSHGCVHLSVENSKWVYENVPNGTRVVVQ